MTIIMTRYLELNTQVNSRSIVKKSTIRDHFILMHFHGSFIMKKVITTMTHSAEQNIKLYLPRSNAHVTVGNVLSFGNI